MTEMTATFNRVIFYCLGNILLWRVCFSFTTLSAYANYKPTSAWLNWRLNSQKVDFLHYVEYPNDDYSHILGINDELHTPSKLQEISASTLKDVALNKQQVDVQGCGFDKSFFISSDDYEADIKEFDKIYGTPLKLDLRIASTYPSMAIAAEFKRASPSKGDINPNLDAVTQCLEYAEVGAAVISVLTDFKFFKGTLMDMKNVRLATQKKFGEKRPAILRKDFILDRYQILEARAHGADTLLLIVAILGVEQLKDLMNYSRSLGMEPLVEVHTTREMEIALSCGAKVIGVNNRNLHTFKLDLDTTERAIAIAEKKGITWKLSSDKDENIQIPNIMIAALSGITSADDVQQFRKAGVSCVLVGETLMKSTNPKKTIEELLTENNNDINGLNSSSGRMLVKTCGLTSVTDAEVALQAGVSLLGVIFAKSPRTVTIEQAKAIVEVTRKYGERSSSLSMENELNIMKSDRLTPKLWFQRSIDFLRKTTLRRPLTVGVFQNQTPEEINQIIATTGIDIVQLHGDESPDIIELIHAPCIKVLHVLPSSSSSSKSSEGGKEEVVTLEKNGNEKDHMIHQLKADINKFSNKAIAILLDSRLPNTSGGGTGAIFDWSIASEIGVSCILAGGLLPSNVGNAVLTNGVVGVDVSSGIEIVGKPGMKDIDAMKSFINNARQ